MTVPGIYNSNLSSSKQNPTATWKCQRPDRRLLPKHSDNTRFTAIVFRWGFQFQLSAGYVFIRQMIYYKGIKSVLLQINAKFRYCGIMTD